MHSYTLGILLVLMVIPDQQNTTAMKDILGGENLYSLLGLEVYAD
jgi:hypothetical protein